jgi:hypothetical protein
MLLSMTRPKQYAMKDDSINRHVSRSPQFLRFSSGFSWDSDNSLALSILSVNLINSYSRYDDTYSTSIFHGFSVVCTTMYIEVYSSTPPLNAPLLMGLTQHDDPINCIICNEVYWNPVKIPVHSLDNDDFTSWFPYFYNIVTNIYTGTFLVVPSSTLNGMNFQERTFV